MDGANTKFSNSNRNELFKSMGFSDTEIDKLIRNIDVDVFETETLAARIRRDIEELNKNLGDLADAKFFFESACEPEEPESLKEVNRVRQELKKKLGAKYLELAKVLQS